MTAQRSFPLSSSMVAFDGFAHIIRITISFGQALAATMVFEVPTLSTGK